MIHDYINECIFCIRTFLPGLFSQRVGLQDENDTWAVRSKYRDPDSISETSSSYSGSILTDSDTRKSHGFKISEYGRGVGIAERHVSVYHVPKVHKPVDVVNREHLREMIAAQAIKGRRGSEDIKLPKDVLQEKMKALQDKVSEDIKKRTSALLSESAGMLGDVTKDSVTAAAQLSLDATNKAKELNDLAIKKMMKTLKGDRIAIPQGSGQQSVMEIKLAESLAEKKAAAIEKQIELDTKNAVESNSAEENNSMRKWSLSSLFGMKKAAIDKKSSGICIHGRQEVVCVVCKEKNAEEVGDDSCAIDNGDVEVFTSCY